MDIQLGITIVLIGGAAAYLLLQVLRTWRGLKGGGCAGGCGCGKSQQTDAPQKPVLIAPEQLKLRRKTQ